MEILETKIQCSLFSKETGNNTVQGEEFNSNHDNHGNMMIDVQYNSSE